MAAAGIEGACSDHRVKAGMEGVQDMESMLKSLIEQQEKLMAKVEGIQEKQDRMEPKSIV